ncbi:MAG: hypothetical protein ACKO4K_04845 [Flavobacteriales bacterium]|jgi:hypothetical protein
MKTFKGKEKLATIINQIEKDGVGSKALIPSLKELRSIALDEKDPLVVKVLRLTYEYLEENQSFDVEGQFEEDEEGNEFPIEVEDKENLLYLLALLLNADQKINRDEIKDYRDALKNSLY